MTDDIRGRVVDIAGDDTGFCTVRCALSWSQQFLRTGSFANAQTTLWQIQPTDTTKAIFDCTLYDGSFSGQDDSILAVGYNTAALIAGAGLAGEPSAAWVIEQNYLVGGVNKIEAYLELGGGASGTVRPIIASLKRSDCSGGVTLVMPPGTGSYLDVEDNAGNQILKFFPANGVGPAGAVLVQTNVKVLFNVPSVGNGLGTLFADAAGNLKYTGPNGTTTILAGP